MSWDNWENWDERPRSMLDEEDFEEREKKKRQRKYTYKDAIKELNHFKNLYAPESEEDLKLYFEITGKKFEDIVPLEGELTPEKKKEAINIVHDIIFFLINNQISREREDKKNDKCWIKWKIREICTT